MTDQGQNAAFSNCLFLVSSQKRGETSRRFERHNQFFEETFGTVCHHPQNIEKILFLSPDSFFAKFPRFIPRPAIFSLTW
jgi:hypothetical protein